MLSETERERLLEACRAIPPAKQTYLEPDFISNILVTVLDFQMHTSAVKCAMKRYKARRWGEIREMQDLQAVLDRFPDDRDGNTALAQHLWGYNLWTRAGMLRGLVRYFDGRGVRTQEALRAWAFASTYSDFAGQVKGLGPAVYRWLVMRQGVETIKPDVHVMRFVQSVLSRPLSTDDAVDALVDAARRLGLKAYELDWRIWEYQRSR